ncbi:hypothetical protein GQ55_5G513600 [Panicum hallii var. hallii]|uniref:Uncharacterized protein n=1 Tax=Panicum hallii var. hallii TaxID=1504633 RepID=A0A2T7DSD6_9POAL|nr:hypothetical protein GQ55_5G513600 [Panicum hallii var. hallii]
MSAGNLKNSEVSGSESAAVRPARASVRRSHAYAPPAPARAVHGQRNAPPRLRSSPKCHRRVVLLAHCPPVPLNSQRPKSPRPSAVAGARSPSAPRRQPTPRLPSSRLAHASGLPRLAAHKSSRRVVTGRPPLLVRTRVHGLAGCTTARARLGSASACAIHQHRRCRRTPPPPPTSVRGSGGGSGSMSGSKRKACEGAASGSQSATSKRKRKVVQRACACACYLPPLGHARLASRLLPSLIH